MGSIWILAVIVSSIISPPFFINIIPYIGFSEKEVFKKEREGAFLSAYRGRSLLRQRNEISELCKRSGEPVYLTKNGEGDLVVMDIEAFARRESMLRLREALVAAEEDRLKGKSGYSIDNVAALMKAAVQEVLDGQRK
mgnify:CR=1 FL=1